MFYVLKKNIYVMILKLFFYCNINEFGAIEKIIFLSNK